jgi:hypothetical protein
MKRFRIRVGQQTILRDYYCFTLQAARKLFDELAAQRWANFIELDETRGFEVAEHIRAWAPGIGIYRR